MTDKAILSNGLALEAKYGTTGAKKIRQSIQDLIKADAGRGLASVYIELDDATAMKRYGKTVVTNSASAQQNKQAVDGVYQALAPDYIVLLGAVDVIPHQNLTNPLFNSAKPEDDPDRSVPSDLPYACEAGYNTAIEKFTGPTRVVGRLPDLTGGTDPAYLIGVLNTAAGAKPRSRADYEPYFSISAEVWKKSTALSLEAIFGGDADEQVCPKAEPPWKAGLIGRRAHFINCDGAPRTAKFYGQHGKNYPVALAADQVTGHLVPGVVAAMECCYGAELYDVTSVPGSQPGIGNTYLANQSFGYLGSTTVAYGPSNTNNWADNLCQYFLESVLAGASLGRALLEARHQYIQAALTPLGPVDLKTLAQFLLLGDPSIQAVEPAPAPTLPKAITASIARNKMFLPLITGRGSRLDRRKDLIANGLALERTWPAVRSRKAGPPPPAMRAQLQKLAAEMGLKSPSMLTFKARAPRATIYAAVQPKALLSKFPDVTAVHVMLEAEKPPTDGVHRAQAIVVREAAGRVISVHRGYAK